jgi:GDP-L-fucose synthase
MNNDLEAIRLDLNRLPVEGVSGKDSETAINEKLSKYGILKDSVEVWGTGKPLREFLWSEEMADACVYVMENVNFDDLKPKGKEIRNAHINIGTGREISIAGLAKLIAQTVGYTGQFNFNAGKPDGTMRKLTDPSRLNSLGWKHKIDIEQGVEKLYKWYLQS